MLKIKSIQNLLLFHNRLLKASLQSELLGLRRNLLKPLVDVKSTRLGLLSNFAQRSSEID
jgi:hypothetical protein